MSFITINWGVNQSEGTESFDLEDLGVESEEVWEAMSEDEKKEKLQQALDDIPSPCYPIVESFE